MAATVEPLIPSFAPAAKYSQEPVIKSMRGSPPEPAKSNASAVNFQLPVSNAKPSSYIATPATEPEPFDPGGPT